MSNADDIKFEDNRGLEEVIKGSFDMDCDTGPDVLLMHSPVAKIVTVEAQNTGDVSRPDCNFELALYRDLPIIPANRIFESQRLKPGQPINLVRFPVVRVVRFFNISGPVSDPEARIKGTYAIKVFRPVFVIFDGSPFPLRIRLRELFRSLPLIPS